MGLIYFHRNNAGVKSFFCSIQNCHLSALSTQLLTLERAFKATSNHQMQTKKGNAVLLKSMYLSFPRRTTSLLLNRNQFPMSPPPSKERFEHNEKERIPISSSSSSSVERIPWGERFQGLGRLELGSLRLE